MKSMFRMIASLACVVALAACGAAADSNKTVEAPQPAYAKTDITAGTGAQVVATDLVQVAYSTWLYDATKPNSRGAQVDASASALFSVGTGLWLPGAEKAVLDSKVGAKFNVVLPANMAFGVYTYKNPAFTAEVASNTPIVMEIQVLKVSKPGPTAAVTINDKTVGTGADALPGKTLSVNYTGWLYVANAPDQHGTQFDTSIGKTPISFTMGTGSSQGDVILGWDRGLVGMKVGGKRTIIIPPELAYGVTGTKDDKGVVVIPPNATLIFDVELMGVK